MNALAELLTEDGLELDVLHGIPRAWPADEGQVVDTLRRASDLGATVIPVGFGSKLSWCRPELGSTPPDLLLSTRRIDRIVDYVPGDGTLTACAGASLATLQDCVNAGGHSLTPAVSDPQHTSLGGVLGAGLSGLDRHRYGPVRHHVLGLRVALSDGTLARSGGKLVKNVTGFDLHRLYTGSRGTLCVILEASMRLFPAPDEQAHLVSRPAAADELIALARELDGLEVTTRAVALENHTGAWRLHVNLTSLAGQGTEDREQVLDCVTCDEVAVGTAAERAFQALRSLESTGGWPQLVVTSPRSRVAAALKAAVDREPTLKALAQPDLGAISVHVPGLLDEPHGEQTRRVLGLSEALGEVGAQLSPRAIAAQAHAALNPSPSERPALRWMQSLQAELDPTGCFRSSLFPG